MTNFQKLYDEYGEYNVLYNQLNLPSPSIEYSWRKTKLLLHKEAIRLIKQIRQQKKQITICDLGSGNGAFLIRLALEMRGLHIRYTGYELSRPFVEYANRAAGAKGLSNISFHYCDVESQPINGMYDIVVSSEVLEHLENPEYFIKKAHRILNPQGCFLPQVSHFRLRNC